MGTDHLYLDVCLIIATILFCQTTGGPENNVQLERPLPLSYQDYYLIILSVDKRRLTWDIGRIQLIKTALLLLLPPSHKRNRADSDVACRFSRISCMDVEKALRRLRHGNRLGQGMAP